MNEDKEIKIKLNLSSLKKNKIKSDSQEAKKVRSAVLNENKKNEKNVILAKEKQENYEEYEKQDVSNIANESKENLPSNNDELKKNEDNSFLNYDYSKKDVNKKEDKKINKKEIINKKLDNYNKITKKGNNKKNKRSKIDKSSLDDVVNMVNMHNSKLNEQRKSRIGLTQEELKEQIRVAQEKLIDKYITIRKFITSFVIFSIIVLVYLFFQYAPIVGIRIPTNVNKNVNIDVVSNDGDIYDTYDNELLIYSHNLISTYNKNGKKTWDYQLENNFTPNIYIYGKYMAVANNSNGIIYLFYGKNEILNTKVDGKIETLYVDEKGNIAVEYSTKSDKKIIAVYDKKGNELYNSYLDFANIIDIKLIENANKVLITKVDSNSFKVGSSISILDGSKKEDNITELIKIDNNAIFDVEYVDNNIVFLTNDSIMKYSIENKEQVKLKEFNSSQMLFSSIMNKYYITIEKALDEKDEYLVNVNNYDNISINTMTFDSAPRALVCSKFLNYFVFQNKIQVVNKWGIEVLSKELNVIPKKIIVFNNNKSAALIYNNNVEITSL